MILSRSSIRVRGCLPAFPVLLPPLIYLSSKKSIGYDAALIHWPPTSTWLQVWLEFGDESHGSPMQLPVVLQILLSQVTPSPSNIFTLSRPHRSPPSPCDLVIYYLQSHRLRALQLLARFLDKGAWAVKLGTTGVGVYCDSSFHG